MWHVDRRHLLSAIGGTAALAGCLNGTDGSRNDTANRSASDEPSNTSDPDDEADRSRMPPFDIPHARYTLSTMDGSDRTVSFVYPWEKPHIESERHLYCGIEVSQGATSDHPAEIRVFLYNLQDDRDVIRPYADEPGLRLLSGDMPTFRRIEHDQGEASVVLAPTERHDLAQRVPDYARSDTGVWYLEERERCLPEEIPIAGGELLEGRFALLASDRDIGFPLGRYDTDKIGDQRSVQLHVWQTSRPGVDIDSRFDFGSVTPLGPFDDLEDAHWYHQASPSTEVYVAPSTEHVEPPAVVSFDAVNHSRDVLEDDTVGAQLYKKVGDRAHPIPHGSGRASYPFPPGERATIAVGVAHGADPPDVGETTASRRTIAVGHLGGGTYVLDGQILRDGRTHAAAFELDASSVALASHETTSIERDGTKVTATLPAPENAERWESATVRRVEEASTQFVVEQVMQDDVLRTALAHLDEGVDRVTVKWAIRSGISPRCDSFLPEDDTFQFDGEAYTFATVD